MDTTEPQVYMIVFHAELVSLAVEYPTQSFAVNFAVLGKQIEQTVSILQPS